MTSAPPPSTKIVCHFEIVYTSGVRCIDDIDFFGFFRIFLLPRNRFESEQRRRNNGIIISSLISQRRVARWNSQTIVSSLSSDCGANRVIHNIIKLLNFIMTYDRYKLHVIKVDSVGQFFKTDGKQQSY